MGWGGGGNAETTDIPDTAGLVTTLRPVEFEEKHCDASVGVGRPPCGTTMMQLQPDSVTNDNESCLDQWTASVLRRRVDSLWVVCVQGLVLKL